MSEEKKSTSFFPEKMKKAKENIKITRADCTGTEIDTKKWFEESEYSPKMFKQNIISRAVGEDRCIRLYYDHEIEENDSYGSYVSIPSCSIKTAPRAIRTIEDSIPQSERVDIRPEINRLYIYGHPLDVNDHGKSRFDEEFINYIHSDFEHKYRYVEISGAFENIKSMQNTILSIYEKLVIPEPISKIRLHLDCRVLDDDGMIRTLAELISSGYINKDIVPRINMIEYVYEKQNPKLYAQIFNDDMEVDVMKFKLKKSGSFL